MRVLYLVFTLALPSVSLFAQPASRASQQPPAFTLHLPSERTRDISLVVSATDSFGRPLPALLPSQLQVRVDRQPVAPLGFVATPRSLVLVFDTINSSLQDMLRAREATQSFLLAHNAHLAQPTSIVIFSDHPLREAQSPRAQLRDLDRRHLFAERLPLTLDGAELNRGLQQLPLGFSRITSAQGGSGQMEQVSLSLKCLAFLADAEAAVPGMKLVVWISPGWPPVFTSAQSRTAAFETVAFFANALQQARIVLNVLDSEPVASVGRQEYWKAFQKIPRLPDQADPNDLALQVLAVQSGGMILGNQHSVEASLALCAGQAQALFLLTFEPPGPAMPPALPIFHELTLQALAPGLILRARPAYVSLPALSTRTSGN